MKKIFLAISEREKEEVNRVITKNFPGMEFNYLESKNEVMSTLQSPFSIFITTSSYVDMKKLDDIELKGKLYLLDSSGQLKVNNPNIFTCKSVDDLVVEFRLSLFSGLQFDKQGSLPSNQKEASQEKEDVDKEESEKNEDPKQEKNEADETANTHSAIENTSEEIQSVVTTTNSDDHLIKESNIEVDNENNKDELSKEEVQSNKDITKNKQETFVPKVEGPTETKVKSPSQIEKALKMGEAMDLVTFKNKKTVGLWAPLSAGVTTFLFDFAIYLQQYDAPVAVVEVPKENQHHLKILERFGSKPDNWVSFIENFHTTTEPNNRSLWMYRGVRWFPLGVKDLTYKRNKEFTNNFFLAVKRTKFVMVDLPTGKMDAATLDSLPHLDELWVFVDDDFDRQLEWSDFITNTLIGKYQLPIKLIHSRSHPTKSRPKDVAEKFNLPLIGVLPSMWDLVLSNKHEKKPLIDNLVAFRKMEPAFHQLAKELIGEELEVKYKASFWLKVKRKLMGSIDSN
ncbi:hypothetical protein ACFFHF_16685 [Robertmurraya beringensis]|uniref:Uncharacterized protein n=1 Tax=Robertmurraya beringensis TaxID=641660 RepID=A0ABV6KU33_9BACI